VAGVIYFSHHHTRTHTHTHTVYKTRASVFKRVISCVA